MTNSHNKIIEPDNTNSETDHQEQQFSLLIYSHDTFGLGHLQRCLKIAQALTESIKSLSILIATGSPVVHRYTLPDRVDYIKLPSVRKVGPEKYESRTLKTSHQDIINLRSSLLLETAKHFKPDFLITDHSPIGMKGEMKPALEWIRDNNPDCLSILGLRDIIDGPTEVSELWREKNIYSEIESLFKKILIYGDRTIYDMVTPCNFTSKMKAMTQFTGYIGDNRADKIPEKLKSAQSSRLKVVVSVGGGDGATEPVMAKYIEMIRKYSDKIEFDSCLISGPFVPAREFDIYKKECNENSIELIRFVDSTTPYFQNADLVISTAGYNSVTQIMQAADRAILIPRVMHRQEQLLRATTLEKAGLIRMIHPKEVTADNLFTTVSEMLNNINSPLENARKSGLINMSGLEEIVSCFKSLISPNKKQVSEHV